MRRDRIVFGRTAFDEVYIDQMEASSGRSEIVVSGGSKLVHITEAGHDPALLIVEFYSGGIMGGWYAITDASYTEIVVKHHVGVRVTFLGGDIQFLNQEAFEEWSDRFGDEKFEVKTSTPFVPVGKYTYEGVKT